ncbi:MAG: hypothetical protein V1749_11030 [Candidatus Desantisbacteria bacterium]
MPKLVGKITNMRYQSFLKSPLLTVSFDTDVNDWPSKCCVKDNDIIYAASKWTGPKRTRTYPLANVYDTLSACGGKTITIIPIVKDEGADSQNMDYLQWDTVQLMSLLNVYVILVYYTDAQKNRRDIQKPNRITYQQLDSDFVKTQIKELTNYHSSALHWNLNQLSPEKLDSLMEKAIISYRMISKKTGVKLHNEAGLETFRQRIITSRESFLAFSRLKSAQAQKREIGTTQPKESLSVGIKTAIEIENYLGGKYFLTVDDVIICNNRYELIESKHSKKAILPGENDIKDGLIKMMLFSNIDKLYEETDVDLKTLANFIPVLRLTSEKLCGKITTNMGESEIKTFFQRNCFRKNKEEFIDTLFKEARANKFDVIIEYGERKEK